MFEQERGDGPEQGSVDFNRPYIDLDEASGIAKVGVRTQLDNDRLRQRYVNLERFNQKLKQKNNVGAKDNPDGLYSIDYEPVEAGSDTPAHINMWLYCTKDDVLRYGQSYAAKFEDKPKRKKILALSAVAAAGSLLLASYFAGAHTGESKQVAPSYQASGEVTHKAQPTSAPQPTEAPTPAEQTTPQTQPSTTPKPSQPATPIQKPDEVTVASINSLGASHTDNKNGKDYGKMPRATKRAAMEADFIAKHSFDVVGLQEFQPPQRRVLLKEIGDRYAIYPTTANYQHHFSVNSIIWKKSKFNLVDSGKDMLHYFGGKMQPMPWVRLETKDGTKFEVHNTHDPADTKHHHRQAIWRQKDAFIHRAEAERLVASGLAGFMTGDYNSRLDEIRHQDRYLIGHKVGRLPLRIMTAGSLVEDAIKNANIDHILITPKHVNVLESHIKRLPKGTTDHPAVWTLAKIN